MAGKQDGHKDAAGSGQAIEVIPVDELHIDPANVRRHPDKNLAAIKASLARFGQQHPIVIDANNVVRAGNGRLEAMRELGWTTANCVRSDLAPIDLTAFSLADNRSGELAEWDDSGLADMLRALEAEEFDLSTIGFTDEEVDGLFGDPDESRDNSEDSVTDPESSAPILDARKSLADRFGVPPFSVLDARQGYWQDRKRAWLSLGIQSEIGRGDCTPGGRGTNSAWNSSPL